MASNEHVPDSWDANGVGDVNNDLSKLNVSAPTFVPGRNIHATTFVPGGTQPAKSNPEPSEEIAVEEQEESNIEAEGEQEEAPDTWEGGSDEQAEEKPEPEVFVPKPKPKKFVEEAEEPEVKKEHINVVFIGHVDAGKSTIGGHLMFLTGMVDKRTLEKYEKEAKEKNRETWYLSWALDTNSEEREKGKTVEVGRAFFETENKHFTILDAPGHKSFVPNMIGGAAQADVAVLVISARRGEFETGFERGGQTREHAMLVKTAGVKHLIVLINKMDEPTVKWDNGRYKECKDKLTPFLKKMGFNTKSDVFFMPCSGYTGAFLREAPPEDVCPWYRGPCLIEYLEKLPPLNRNQDGAVRMPVVDKYKDMGTIILGKLESGTIKKSDELVLMPNKVTVEVMQLWSDDNETDRVVSGENVKLKLKNIEDDEVSSGFILCSPLSLCHVGETFDAHVLIIDYRSIICSGYTAVMHLHTCSEEVTFVGFHYLLDRKTGEKVQKRPRFVKQDQAVIARLKANNGRTCMESFEDFPQLGRFTLRDEGRSVAIGKILKVVA